MARGIAEIGIVLGCVGLAAPLGASVKPMTDSLASPPAQVAGDMPVEVTAHPDPLALLRDDDPARAANKQLVFDMWRSIVNAGHVELADEMLQEGYIQHSPILPTGREAFKRIFSVVKRRDIPALVSPPAVAMLAEGDLVVMALREELPEPAGGGHYTTTHFNMFRIENGRLAEHWHSIQDAPGPGVLAPSEGGPQRVVGASGPAQLALLQAADAGLAANKRLVFDAWRQVMEAGRAELAESYFQAGYIEHDPNLRTGLAALKHHVAAKGAAPVGNFIRAPIVALLAQGDLVALVAGREHPYPGRAGETYTTTGFDLFRIENAKIAEHWDGESKPGTPAIDYGN